MRILRVLPVLLAFACGLFGACGGPQPPAPGPAVVPDEPPRWRLGDARAGEIGVTLRCQTPCFVRFRVEGAGDAPHT